MHWKSQCDCLRKIEDTCHVPCGLSFILCSFDLFLLPTLFLDIVQPVQLYLDVRTVTYLWLNPVHVLVCIFCASCIYVVSINMH